MQVLALCQINQTAILGEIGAGRLLQHHRPAALQGQPGQLEILKDPALDNHPIEWLAQELLGTVEDPEVRNLRCPALLALGGHLRIGIMEADQDEFLGMLRHLTNDPVGVRMPHSQHSESHGS